MKILGIVAEYNPFHNGHKYHLEKSIETVNPDYTIAVMSGNFVQRGEPALINKFIRANMTIDRGIDLVVELPTYFATSSAETFAFGAISLLNECNVTHLSFGSESGDMDELSKVADLLTNESDNFKDFLANNLAKGISFPKARSLSLKAFIPSLSNSILEMPNNCLGIEYLKALKKTNSKIEPITITRYATDYNSLETKHNICSASAIREMLKNNSFSNTVLPPSCFDSLIKGFNKGLGPVFLENFNNILIYKIRSMSLEELSNIHEVSEGLENRIKDAANNHNDINEIIEAVKSKRYTLTRIKRIMINILLDIKKHGELHPQYIRVLACSKKAKKELLGHIANNSSIPVITSLNRFMQNATEKQLDMINKDILATDIYSLGCPTIQKSNLDWVNKI